MTDYTVRELMETALDGLSLPAEDVTELVLDRAASRRTARRGGAVLGAAAGIAVVVGVAVLLPQVARGGSRPGSSGAGATVVTEVTSSPRAIARSGTTTAPKAPAATTGTSSTSASGSAAATGESTGPATQDYYVLAADQLAALLPAGIGKVSELAQPSLSPQPGSVVVGHGRMDGRYLIARDRRVAYLDITSYDPEALPAQVPVGLSSDPCTGDTSAPANTDCLTTTLKDGSKLVTLTRPAGQDEPNSGHYTGPGYDAWLQYPDGRSIYIVDMSGISGAGGYGTPFTAPPLTKSELNTLVVQDAWFK